MTTQTETAATFHPRNPAKGNIFLRALNAIAELERRYREAEKLRNMPDERLADMGISPRAAALGGGRCDID